MRRISTDAIAAVSAAALATVLYVVRRADLDRWPSSLPGHLFGVLGLVLMLWAAFGYAWRKRRAAPGAMSMQRAMRLHVTAGLLGPFLVILHSGFAFAGVAGLATLVMIIVVASGVVGRAILTARPTQVEIADPVRVALLDAERARLETAIADLGRTGAAETAQLDALRTQLASVRHEQEFQRAQWQQPSGARWWRRLLSAWWLVHVPLSAALWILAVVHVAAALYFATFSR